MKPAALLLAAALSAPPALLHAQPRDQRQDSVNSLLQALKQVPNQAAAVPIEYQLRRLWLDDGSPAVGLLMKRGLRELQAGENSQAIEDFGDAIVLDPKFAEAYHQRARARYHDGDIAGAIVDLEAALQRQPNDFTVLATLSNIAEAQGNWKGAFEAWQKVLQIDPMTAGGQDRLKQLKLKAFGEQT
ncbi:MAG TPA: hypothetical protein VFN42_01100 [Acetobacteraceae bacterium]|nr:hypothetical protein [Acetobacteraceae bacterium]